MNSRLESVAIRNDLASRSDLHSATGPSTAPLLFSTGTARLPDTLSLELRPEKHEGHSLVLGEGVFPRNLADVSFQKGLIGQSAEALAKFFAGGFRVLES